MRTLLIALALLTLALPVPGAAQDEGPGRLARLLQDALSGAGRDVRIEGFEGALSSSATIERLTIADARGVWFTAEGVALDWNRAALLQRRVAVERFAAERIEMPRRPDPAERAADLPAPEAQPFSLPELPVSLQIGAIAAEEVALGAPVLGEAMRLTVEGSASLQRGGGALSLALRAARTDARRGVITLDAAFDPETATADLDLLFDEGPGGLVAQALGIPGAPALRLEAAGAGPVDALDVDIRLASDGTERLTGRVALRGPDETGGDWRAALDLGGDMTPLFAPELRGFFGPDVRLRGVARRAPAGAFAVEELTLDTRALRLDGAVTLGADGWPRAVDVTGEIAAPDGGPVRLPTGGAAVRIDRAALSLAYDAARGEAWQGRLSVAELQGPDLSAVELRLGGAGTLRPPAEETPGRVTADLRIDGDGLGLSDAALAAALGPELIGTLRLAYTGGGPLTVEEMDLSGADYALTGGVALSGLSAGFEAEIDAALAAESLARFGPLAGRDLGGAADLAVAGRVTPLSGAFDLQVEGTGRDLALGVPTADRLLAGRSTLDVAAARGPEGLTLRRLDVATPALTLEAEGRASSDGSRLRYAAALTDLSRLSADGRGAGRARLSGEATLDGRTLAALSVSGQVTGPEGARAAVPLGPRETLRLARGTVSATLDGDAGRWDVATRLDAPRIAGVAAAALRLEGDGTLTPGEATPLPRAAAGRIALTAEGLDARDPDLAAALGDRLSLATRLDYGAEGGLALSDLELGADAAQLAGEIALAPPFAAPAAQFDLALETGPLGRFSGIAGRALGGRATATLTGAADAGAETFDVTLDAALRDARLGAAPLDALLGRDATLSLAARRTEAGRIAVPRLRLEGAGLSARASGDESAADYALRLADVGVLVPDFAGPATLEGRARAVAAGWRVDAEATGPGGSAAEIAGTVANDLRLDLSARGTAPLGLANAVLAPRRLDGAAQFDLRIAGPPRLSSVSGRVTAGDARLSLPAARMTLDPIRAEVALSNGRAQLDLAARPDTGGQLSLTGETALRPPFDGDLEIALDRVGLRDPQLYETTVDGTLTVRGPLTGGATIAGRLSLPGAEVRVPSSGVTALGALPQVRHVAPPPAVRRTLSYAGLTPSGESPREAEGRPPRAYPLDLEISAPARIFVRGRGLDAELGGTLRLTGTTAAPIPQGGFELIRGRLDLLGERFRLSEGVARIEGDFTPYLRLVVTTERDDVTVSIVLEGQADDPEVRFTSAPPLPEDEVLAQLLFGRGVEDLSALQLVQLANGVATLSGRGNGAFAALRSGLGFDDLDIAETEEGGAAVRAGAYLSENIYTDVTVESGGRSEINLNLDLSPDVTVRGGVSTGGTSRLGIFYERDY